MIVNITNSYYFQLITPTKFIMMTMLNDYDYGEDEDDFSEANIVQKFSHGNYFEYFLF